MKFDDFIQSVGFSKSDEDHCLFTKTTQDRSPVFLIIYMDDMLLSGQHARELTELVRKLRLKFAMKDLCPARHILGMKISRHREERQLFLSQTNYIRRVLELQAYSVTPTRTSPTVWTVGSQQPDTVSNSAMEQSRGSRNFRSAQPP